MRVLMFFKRSPVFLILIFVFAGFKPDSVLKEKSMENQLVWSTTLPNLGTLSSPRATDLNGDGILDLVVGMGRIEFQASDTAIVALDGKSGDIIWKRPAIDQIYGSATLLDINKDGVEDVLIGGRSRNTSGD
ncbi:FG-GAP repeat domain-containing protein [Aquiflexum balticum]|uniref:FG-GAP repeat domain-containing protein n=1 Tax=Aquiflexum balticum TaxID=280473 RepID=UPI001560EEBC|nr:VCBS repeat-containing protein [Aquiflexum balticum]